MAYTARQLRLYHAAALRAEAAARADAIEAAWLGMAAAWGDSKKINDYLRELRGPRDGK